MEDSDYFDTVFQTKDIIRMALLVAFSDGSLHPLEFRRAEEVFSEIANEYLGEHKADTLLGQVERIANDLRVEIEGLEPHEIVNLAVDAAGAIEGATSQEVAMIASIKIAYGDLEIDPLELRAIKEIANGWGLSIKDLI